jgi:GT2 family glycosyltransferase
MKLSIVIVNYNVQYFLEQALRSVRKATQNIDCEVFIVDNNSSDGSVEMVRNKFPDYILIANTTNSGFAVANNQAIRCAKGEYVLLLNPDTVVAEDTFHQCIAFMDAHPKAGALGVRMIDGSGAFLPESKRGFPSPFTAFCKTFGLSALFPSSKTFNQYYLGHLSEHDTNPVDVLAGAFMWMRRSVLEEIGMLDEDFFMYGEDIDLSYRVTKAGYLNYYLPKTTILHYKGESTKKGSLNYVRVFYQAMIIFAKKHFTGSRATIFIGLLQFAIYFRAILTVLANIIRASYLPLIDAFLMMGGLIWLKNFWAVYYFKNPNYYTIDFLKINVPLYISIWLSGIFINGGYDEPFNLRRLIGGLFSGTLLLAAVYGFLPLELRTSRMLIVLGAIWAILSTLVVRLILHYLQFRHIHIGKTRDNYLVIVGSVAESKRALDLLQLAEVTKRCIGIVSPSENKMQNVQKNRIGTLSQLADIIHIYTIDEIIFCAKDVESQAILRWMSQLGAQVQYKILPEESQSIIGSSSKNTSGELYTLEVRFAIATPLNRRNKRVFDVIISVLSLAFFPIFVLLIEKKTNFIGNICAVLLGKKTWVGYAEKNNSLPKLRTGILHPSAKLNPTQQNANTRERLDFLYAKDYNIERDMQLVWQNFEKLGN